MLLIEKKVYDEMLEHCIKSFPYEACGILAGKEKVTDIYRIKNIESSYVSYFMEPIEQLKAMKDIRTKGINMIAIYHSHPYGNAYPSQKDRELAFYDVYYVIIAIKPEVEVRCFMISDNKIDETDLIID